MRQRRADEQSALDRATLDRQAIAHRLEQEMQAEEWAKQQKERQAAAMRNLQQMHQQSAAQNLPRYLTGFQQLYPPQHLRPAAPTSSHSAHLASR